MKNVYPFVNQPAEFEVLSETRIVKALQAAEQGDLKPLKAMYMEGGLMQQDYLIKGYYRLRGWHFDLKPYCKRYLVNQKHYGWQEFYAPYKTALYAVLGRHNVLEIHQINQSEEN